MKKIIEVMPTTRKAALLFGEKYYRTEKPCKNGHISKRETVSSNCLECLLMRGKNFYYSEQGAAIRDSRAPLKQARNNELNKLSSKESAIAGRRGAAWTDREIKIVTSRGDDGNYKLSLPRASELLFRSRSAIMRIREKYKK